MLQQLANWLGPRRTRLLIVLLFGTAFLALGAQIIYGDEDWLLPLQIGLIWLFMLGLLLVLGSRMTGPNRRQLWIALGPALVLLGLGVIVPGYALFFGGGAFGWMVAAQIVLRNRVRMEYQVAVKHLRNSEYQEAIQAMDSLIEAEPDDPHHYRFRAELKRLANQLSSAHADYERIVKMVPDSPDGYIGLAEVAAQQGDLDAAKTHALAAYERGPRDWLVSYTLGMIADHRGESSLAVSSLKHAVKLGLPDSRYRLLTRLWLARNYYLQGESRDAERELNLLQQLAQGWHDWQVVFESEQAEPLRAMLGDDVVLAGRLLEGEATLEELGKARHPSQK